MSISSETLTDQLVDVHLNSTNNVTIVLAFPMPYTISMKLLSVKQAAEVLGVNPSRVRQIILEGKLPSMLIGNSHVIKESDLKLVANRPKGRPPKAEVKSKAKNR